jgi:hypothetical protein
MGVAFGSTDMQLPGILVHPGNVPCEADCASIFLGLDDRDFSSRAPGAPNNEEIGRMK